MYISWEPLCVPVPLMLYTSLLIVYLQIVCKCEILLLTDANAHFAMHSETKGIVFGPGCKLIRSSDYIWNIYVIYHFYEHDRKINQYQYML